jgi:hypothetical protein
MRGIDNGRDAMIHFWGWFYEDLMEACKFCGSECLRKGWEEEPKGTDANYATDYK